MLILISGCNYQENLEKCGNKFYEWNGYSCCANGQGCWFPDWKLEELNNHTLERFRNLNCSELLFLLPLGDYIDDKTNHNLLIQIIEEKRCK